MSRSCDSDDEMPDPDPGLSPVPTRPLATAVNRRPKEKQPTIMKSTGIFQSRTARALAVSTTLFIGLSTAAAAGALPGTAQHTVASAVHSVTSVQLPDGGHAATGAHVGASLPLVGRVGAGATANAGAKTTGHAGATAGAGVEAQAALGDISATVGGTVGGSTKGINSSVSGALSGGVSSGHSGSGVVPGLGGITAALTACLSGVLTTASGQPLVALGRVIPTVVACIENVIASLPVPTLISSCVSGLLGSLSSLPVIGSGNGRINLTGCVPIDLSTCLQAAINSVGGLLGGLTGVTNLPSGIVACASSIVNGVINVVNSVLGQVTGTVGGLGGLGGLGGAASATASAGLSAGHKH